MRTRVAVIILSLSALTLAACAADEPDESADEGVTATEDGTTTDAAASGSLTLGADDIFYVHDGQESTDGLALTAAAGEVEITLDNQGALPHNVVVEEAGDTLVVEAEAGASESGTIELEAGEYTLYCDIVGHREAGMEATLQVQ